jgi:hypothetical protein
MSEASDIRTLLTSKSRAKVTPRDTSLSSKRPTLGELDESSTTENVDPISPEPPTQSQDLSGLLEELDNLPVNGKRLAIHLEQEIRADLVQLCDHSDITAETFIEAAVALLQDKPALLKEVIADAKVRLRQRKRAGLVKRTLAMVQKYNG